MNFYVCQKFESWISLTNYPKLAEILKQKSWVLLRMVKISKIRLIRLSLVHK